MAEILLIEDDKNIGIEIIEYLNKAGFSMQRADSLEAARKKLAENIYDLALLDINLPDGNGYILLEELKRKNIRVIITTVNNNPRFIADALDKGADDYICKPFDLAVLRARINAALRTRIISYNNQIIYKNLCLNTKEGRIYYKNKEIDFTALEFNILSLFIRNPSRIFTREILLDMFWTDKNQFVNDNTLTVTIKRIRDKTDKDIITTIRGIGYRLD